MRLGVVINELEVGGAERLVLDLLRKLKHYGIDSIVFPLSPGGALKDLAAEVSVVVSLGYRGGDPRLLNALIKNVERANIDVLHLHLPRAAVVGRLAARALCFHPVVYTEHSIWASYGRIIRALNRLTLGWTDHVIAVSEHVRHYLMARGVPPTRVTTILNSIDASAVRSQSEHGPSLRGLLGLSPESPIIGCVANLRRLKSLDTLLETLPRLRARWPELRAIVIGRDDGDGRRLSLIAHRLGVSDIVYFLGARNDAVVLMREFTVFVLPSWVEGMPISLLEAMALRRPIVATAVGGIPEVINDKLNGRLVPPGTPDALSLAIDELLSAPEQAKAMGEAACEQVVKMCSLETAAERHAQLYRRLVSNFRSDRSGASESA